MGAREVELCYLPEHIFQRVNARQGSERRMVAVVVLVYFCGQISLSLCRTARPREPRCGCCKGALLRYVGCYSVLSRMLCCGAASPRCLLSHVKHDPELA